MRHAREYYSNGIFDSAIVKYNRHLFIIDSVLADYEMYTDWEPFVEGW